MPIKDVVFLVFELLGGLALFIFGMSTMSRALGDAVGDRMRVLLNRATRNRFAGVGLGSLIGFFIQSSASVVLYIGFINAGLMTLSQSMAPILGANIGTSLSIQLISFKLSDYALVAIFLGLMGHLISRRPAIKHSGLALLGFGLLFLGMTTMSSAIKPYRDVLEPFLTQISGDTLSGLFMGTLVAALITGVIQSSGAVIGMGFALISAGAITDLAGIYPIVIGANIGTCVTGLLGSIGTTIDARRAAIAHLVFNVISTLLAILAAPLFYRYIPLTSSDLIHQAANANTLKMVISALLFLPLTVVYAKCISWIVPSRIPQPQPSFLTADLLKMPEQAICACLQELQRTARICAQSLGLAAEEFIQHDPARVQRIKGNEQSINRIKTAMRDYLAELTGHYLSKRQSILIEHIDRCMSDLERIGDHIDNLADIAARQRSISTARFGPEMVEDWLAVEQAVDQLLAKVIESLNPEAEDFQAMAKEVLELRKAYTEMAMAVQNAHFKRLEEKAVTPIAGVLFNDYLSNFQRITKHIKSIALAEQQPQFWIKRDKLTRVMSTDAPGYTVPDEINPDDYLDRLQSEGYL